MKHFSALVSVIANQARCTSQIKFSIAMAKEAFHKKQIFITSKSDLN
jgi:hypothetical protein